MKTSGRAAHDLSPALPASQFTPVQIDRQAQPSRGYGAARVPGPAVFGILAPALHHPALPHTIPRHRGVKGHSAHAAAR